MTKAWQKQEKHGPLPCGDSGVRHRRSGETASETAKGLIHENHVRLYSPLNVI